MIINSHVHVNTNNNFFFYSNYTMERLIKELDENSVDVALPSLNPKVGELRCRDDCSFSCRKCNYMINNDLQNCSGNCSRNNRHRVFVDSEKELYRLKCKTCGKVIIEEKQDPLRKYNIELMEQAKKYHNRIYPLLYISLCESTIQKEIDFYENNFKGMYCGYKFHPWTDQVSIRDFTIKTSMPILIHTGLREYENVENAIYFAKRHPKNKVVIAHAAQLKKPILCSIEESSNIYLDCCPADFLYRNKASCIENSFKINSPEDIFYIALSMVSSKKIMFGTDSPWGTTKREIEIIFNLKISNEARNNILFKTAREVYF